MHDASSTSPSTISTTTPSLAFAMGFAWCQLLLLTGAVFVLGLALTMMARMYRTLSTPTKAMVCMMTASFLGAVVSLTQAWHQLVHLLGGHFLAPDDRFCAYSHPVFEATEAVAWWGHLLLAWVTWKTIHGHKTSPLVLNVLLCGVSVAIGVLVTAGLLLQAPGKVLWGLFCVTPFLVDSNHLDIRWFRGLVCQVTLALSILLYASGYWTLWRKGSGAAAAASPAVATPTSRQTLRLRRASKALLQRAVLLLVAYYLPYVMIHCVMSLIQEKDVPPSPTNLALFFLAFVFGQSVLQAALLIHAAVTVGHNLLRSESNYYDNDPIAAATGKRGWLQWQPREKKQQEKKKKRSASEQDQASSSAGQKMDGAPTTSALVVHDLAAASSSIAAAVKKVKKRAMHDPHRGHTRTRSRDRGE